MIRPGRKSSRFPRAVGGIAAALTLALTLSGCSLVSFLDSTTSSGRDSVPTGESVDPELMRFYAQELEWSSLGPRLDETVVTVPLDWSDPEGETIEIALARHHTGGAAHGSLLVNPGGPGGSGYDFVVRSAAFAVTPDVLGAFDVVGFDPRGVGRSAPVVCYTDPAEQDEFLYGGFDSAYGSDGWIDELTARTSDWAAACLENTGPLLGHLDAVSVARDLDVIRAVLGDVSLSYLGYSYGSYLGAVYAELFPEKVGRMVLDGAVDPLVGDLEALATQMAGFDGALRAYLARCLASEGCPFAGSAEEAARELRALLGGVDSRGLVARDGRELDSATMGTAIASALYSEASWSRLTELLAAVMAGDADPAFASADRYYSRVGGRYDGNSNEIYIAVTCNEGDLGRDGVAPLDGLEVIDARAPLLGRYLAYDDYAVLDVICTNWPLPAARMPASFSAEGAPSILVIGTTNDPATPYANAVSLAGQLSSGVLVSYQGEGHTIYAHGVRCVDDTVDAYLLRGVVPDADPRC